MNKEKIKGLIAAPFTPMNGNGEINLKMVELYSKHLVRSKVEGAFVCGTTGEGISMTTEERKLILEEWVKHSGKDLKVICHVGGTCLPQAVDLAEHAQKSGACSIAAFAPFFFRPESVRDLVSFFEPIAGAAPGIPFYYYHFPSLTGINIQVSDFLAEADGRIPTLAGVKFTHFDLYDMQKCIAYENGKYEILHGYDEVLLCGLALGVKSAVGSTYNYMPLVYQKIWEAFDKGDLELARHYQQISVNVVNQLIKHGGGVRAGKAAMEFIGIDCGPCRLPIRKMGPEEKETFRIELSEAGFFSALEE